MDFKMLQPTLSIGGSPVFAAGSCLTINDASLNFQLFPNNPYIIELRFTQTGKQKPAFSSFPEGVRQIVLADSFNLLPGAITNTSALYVANYQGRKVMALFSIEAVGTAPVVRTVSYTFYDGGNVA